MSAVAAILKDIQDNPASKFLPPFIAVCAEHSEIETRAKAKRPEQLTSMAIIKGRNGELGNSYWIAVSGYRLDCAALVYRFFLDIGHIVDKSFTSSNRMYLKYHCLLDCEMALSYDGQKVGYGADMLVSVKLENPVFQIRIESTKATVIADHESSTCVIDIEAIDKPLSPQAKQKPKPKPMPKRRKWNFLQWLKHKISYIFYLNET